ncbi:transporter, putative [Talaromyces stipitatus ATCC 10500]|uniref:Transporter, putative n=1 Tax=Talaromyces stipitatus (strain ATCC 10500 / CBS 375.48 / QM 6759 / NRRL 1006) TaxID=441959 RepID=B8MTH2_TALSN|nr:transporter, putative [Talaromyces stipitatus ATCC 10500]EED12304.1 transporter, putative [Talaromyces stipitatus ATCC 10500]
MSSKEVTPVDGQYLPSSSNSSKAEDVGTTTVIRSDALEALRNRVSGGDATFDQTEDPRYYKPIDTYEGIHRWDPEFEWEEWEEKKLVRKIDLRIMTFACLTFFALQLDRGNLVQATSDNMLSDLGLTTNNYNTGNTIFLVCFLFAELPSQLISKRLGPDRWIPIQMVSWSLIASCQAFLTGRSTFYATRALLGLFEGGFIPDTILFLSYWYKSKELPVRLSFFWSAYELTAIIGAFLAYGFLHIHTSTGTGQWRYLFALEGLITGVIGIFAAFYMPASPTQTAGRFRGKNGWFSEREEKIMVNRVIRDDPSKGSMHNRQAITPKLLIEALYDYDMWPIYLVGLVWLIPTNPVNSYLSLELRSLGFSTFHTNLLTIPAYVIFIINLGLFTWLSEKLNQRLLLGAFAEVWNLAMLIALETMPRHESAWARYAVLILLIGSPYMHAAIVAMTSRNSGSVRTRTVASAVYNMTVQTSSIIGANIYRSNDAPLYLKGNKVLIGIASLSLFLFLFAKIYYDLKNYYRARKWNAMSSEERDAYLAANKDSGNKRLDFRFVS